MDREQMHLREIERLRTERDQLRAEYERLRARRDENEPCLSG